MQDTVYLFDVDGTLTPSRGVIDPAFREQFLEFAKTHHVGLVTGSDYPKTLEQLGEEICNTVGRVYNCQGNEVRKQGTVVHQTLWSLPDDLHFFLLEKLFESKFKLRTGNHIETRTGLVNFSVVGRNANAEQRKQYIEHDLHTQEREQIAAQINVTFPHLTATVGGETGIDICEKGKDKRQVLADIDKDYSVVFFGDSTAYGGNDFTLAAAIMEQHRGSVCAVSDWHETQTILENTK